MTDTYYDRFTRSKKWHKLLFRGGEGLQSAELNEVQSVLRDTLSRHIALSVRDGEIIAGMDLIVDGTTARVASGTIYYAGGFHDFAGGTLTITGVGEESIGLLFVEQIITESDDTGLLDPATGLENFGLPGAHRLSYTLTLALDSAEAVPLYVLRDGVQVIEQRIDPLLQTIYQLLARRTLDESGSYLVWGLESWIEARDSTTYHLVTEAGKAYVQGWELTQSAARRTVVDRPLDARAVLSEPHTYTTGTDTYTLNTTPAQQITAVSAVVRKTDQSVTRGGTPGGSDVLPFTPVSAVINVKQGATTYTLTTDYLVVGNAISWSPGGIEPATGSTYTVTFDYVKQLQETTDYVLTGGDTLDISAAAEKPNNGSVMYVNYDAYLSRYDLLCLDIEGNFILVRGTPDFAPFIPPLPAGRLLIATLYYPPNGETTDVVVTNSGLYRHTMEDLARIARRVQTLEYNTAVSDLEQSAFNTQLASAKKAIFTDGLHDLTKADTGHGDYSCALDFDKTTMPAFALEYFDLAGVADERLMLAYTLSVVASQPFATGTININPYSTFVSSGAIALSPADDIAIHTTQVLINNEVHVPTRSFKYWVEQARQQGLWVNPKINPSTTIRDLQQGELLGTRDERIVSEISVVGQSRDKTVTVTGSFFPPSANNLALTFDGLAKALTPTGGTQAGTNPDTVRANASGAFTATFPVASGVAGGSKLVVVTNGTERAEAQYTIGQVNRTTTLKRTNFRICPIAESFTVPEDMFIAALDLYFSAKDASLPVEVMIRSMENGLPGSEVLARATLLPAAIATSANASAATRVTFPTPAYCVKDEEYCIVLMTKASGYHLYTAQLSQRDIVSNKPVSSNPYSGVLFLSANNSTWTPRQDSDIKFVLHRANFSSPRVINFTPLTVDGSAFAILTQQVLPAGTAVLWQYSTDGGSTYTVATPNAHIDTAALMTGGLRIRATLSGTSRVSPVIGQDGQVIVTKWDASGAYVGRNVDLGAAYSDLYVYADVSTPSGTGLVAHYSVNGGSAWTSLGNGTAGAVLGDGFTEYAWSATSIGGSPTQMKLKLAFTANAGRTLVPRVRRIRMIAT